MGTARTFAAGAFLALAGALMGGTHQSLALPQGFKEEIVFQGLADPTSVRFSPDGRVFVAEKSGVIKVFDNLNDTAPTVLVNLGPKVHNFWDRGLLSIALHPNFPSTPHLYALYTYDYHPLDPAHPAPRYGDTCPDTDANGIIIGPGATADGCVVDGRVSRLTVNPNNTVSGGENVLLENRWCQQFPTHSIGTIFFGPEGALYVSAGDGANFDFEDWGQYGGTRTSIALPTPANPCGDPDTPRGTPTTKPGAEGGALRSQGLRTPGGNITLDGTVVRIDPVTGAAWPTNPFVGGSTAQDDPIIAYGLRNPFRMTPRPGTEEIWLGDVGWYDWEEINRILDPDDAVVENFGWPCLEGPDRPLGYNAGPPDDLDLCTSLLDQEATAPYHVFEHYLPVHPGDPCDTASGSSISGLAFYQGGTYPAAYQGALFFADFSRSCIFVMPTPSPGSGNPDPASITAFLSSTTNPQQVGDPHPVEITIGPGGDLFVVGHVDGTIRRITYNAGNSPPTARIQATPTNGPVPLTVSFNGGGSTDPDPGSTLFYAWDLDGDGQYDDGALRNASWVYTVAGDVVVGLRVTDDDDAISTTSITIAAGNSTPTATIAAPLSTMTWHVGEAIAFSGEGQDPDDGALGAASMAWEVILHHCASGPETCHGHDISNYDGIASGSFTAPDHQYYSELEFVLTVTDSGGLTDTEAVVITPEAAINSYASSPQGAALSVSGFQAVTPFQRGAIVGSTNTLVAASPQIIGGTNHYFVSWNDGGGANRSFVQDPNARTYHANFAACQANEFGCNGLDDDCDGTIDDGDLDNDGTLDCVDSDDDNDGVQDPADCAPLNATAHGQPVAVSGLSVGGAVPTPIAWTAQSLGSGTQYVVATGTIATQAVVDFPAGTCLGVVATAQTTHPGPNPPPGQVRYFMVKSRNACGPGTFGSATRDTHPGCP